jgi:cell wall-associated NlpC family hydrolase
MSLMLILESCQLTRRVGHLFSAKEGVETIYSSKEINNLVETAFHYQGVPYRNGGTNEKGMDCSGLLYRVYADNNLMIPRPTFQQALFGAPVAVADIRVGDWLFFKTNNASNINHVGLVTKIKSHDTIYFIHASTSKGVREDILQNKYWMKAYVKSLRPYKNNSN